ncbi:hypothetical protein Asppvi_005864 [Aspergillus pseudoviridinutans]|uniref:MADS-box domain-containing protein n=1 Tax=Aspergillus pseudoviridinutans TaxID=1517512 RepID=A0A9P3EVN0_9EURO|nr:uncharacterized protein Asppvi_005864 [Aspergillus pseudoviridinutans]GIJ86965.1 hypothetical protein Asppvi_005864 [Aspergillus pseudoviridinutans]
MAADPSSQIKRRQKNEKSRFKRHSDRLLEHSDEFGKLFDAKIYLLIQNQKGDLTIYNNRLENEWPPSQSELLRLSEHSISQNLNRGDRKDFSGQTHKKDRTKFEKKKDQLLQYGNSIAQQFAANVYLAIQCRTGYTIVHNSSSSKNWPPSRRQIKLLFPSAKRKYPEDFDGSPDLLQASSRKNFEDTSLK